MQESKCKKVCLQRIKDQDKEFKIQKKMYSKTEKAGEGSSRQNYSHRRTYSESGETSDMLWDVAD